MRVITFATRNQAREFPLGKLIDNGPEVPKAQRWGRGIPGLSGSSRQRRQALRQLLRSVS